MGKAKRQMHVSKNSLFAFSFVEHREFSVDGVLIHNYKMTFDARQAT